MDAGQRPICQQHPTVLQYRHLTVCPVPVRPERCDCGSNNFLAVRGAHDGYDTFLCMGCESPNNSLKCEEPLILLEQVGAFRE